MGWKSREVKKKKKKMEKMKMLPRMPHSLGIAEAAEGDGGFSFHTRLSRLFLPSSRSPGEAELSMQLPPGVSLFTVGRLTGAIERHKNVLYLLRLTPGLRSRVVCDVTFLPTLRQDRMNILKRD